MELRKNSKVNLENKRKIFLEIGFIVTLLLVLAAFEYRSYEKNTIDVPSYAGNGEIEEMAPVVYKKPEPPKPPPLRQVVINLVDDNTLSTDDFPEIDIEIDPDDEIPVYYPKNDEDEDVPDDIGYVEIPGQKAFFPGGMKAMYQYLRENLEYPALAKELGITGTVYLEFMVEKDGSITNIKVLRPIGGGCTEEAMRVVQEMPNWIPAKQLRKPVKTKMALPIKFSLSSF